MVARRSVLALPLAAFLADALSSPRRPFSGRVVGATHARGHLVRDGARPGAPEARADVDVAIVGGGVAGLAAAWRLAPAGLSVEVLELEDRLGGTSSGGYDGVVPYPWGAHYLAAPNPDARGALRLLADMGVVTGWDAANRPTFDPRVLCHSPQERIFYDGHWFDGLVPTDALTEAERAELARFSDLEAELTRRVGRDGRPAFTIPMHLSSRDPDLLALDRMSLLEWLEREGFRSEFLRWLIEYSTLDDFGSSLAETSAWAGLHYFAARKLKTPELAGSHFLVWPDGNGRLTRELSERSGARLTLGDTVLALEQVKGGVLVHSLREGRAFVTRARAVVVAAPSFVARRLVPAAHDTFPRRESSPWLVANLHVRLPRNPNRAWDSVLHGARGLGYVDAGHQRTVQAERTVLTYYRAFGDPDCAGTRRRMLASSWSDLARDVLLDLSPAHPHLHERVERLDVALWAHAMPRPRPGFLGERLGERLEERLGEPPGLAGALVADRIAWAHADQAGVGLFEESQARGIGAAEALAPVLGLSLGETWC